MRMFFFLRVWLTEQNRSFLQGNAAFLSTQGVNTFSDILLRGFAVFMFQSTGAGLLRTGFNP